MGYRDNAVQGLWGTSAMDTWITGVQGVWAHGQWGTWVMGHMPIIMHISRWGTWALGCRGIGYGGMGTWAMGHMGDGTYAHNNAYI